MWMIKDIFYYKQINLLIYYTVKLIISSINHGFHKLLKYQPVGHNT